jgi:hypothetical protein
MRWVWWLLFCKEGSISRQCEIVWRIFARSTVVAETSCSQDMDGATRCGKDPSPTSFLSIKRQSTSLSSRSSVFATPFLLGGCFP